MSTNTGVTIRHACREDVPTILQLIRELAEYEKEPDAVEATPEKLLNTLAFAPSPSPSPSNTNLQNPSSNPSSEPEPISPSRPARCILLFGPAGEVGGMALYFYNYSTWRARTGIYLEDLFVREKERGKGYGGRLLRELAREVVGLGGGRLDWSVLKWNRPSIEFYERKGARVLGDWHTMRVEGEGLGALAGREG